MQRSTSLDATARWHFPGGTDTCVHVPAPSQRPAHRSFPSGAHAIPAGSARQRAEQQSRSALMPTSQFSRGSITPFPHLVAEIWPAQALTLDVHVLWLSSPSPVPLQAKSQSPATSPVTENAPVAGSTVPARESGYVVELMEQEPLTRMAGPVFSTVELQAESPTSPRPS